MVVRAPHKLCLYAYVVLIFYMSLNTNPTELVNSPGKIKFQITNNLFCNFDFRILPHRKCLRLPYGVGFTCSHPNMRSRSIEILTGRLFHKVVVSVSGYRMFGRFYPRYVSVHPSYASRETSTRTNIYDKRFLIQR